MIHHHINQLILPYQTIIGKNYASYKNHVHRISQLTLEIKKELSKDDEQKIAIAAVFHDIGIWTANTFDYLEPSKEAASNYLKSNGLEHWTDEILIIIDNHHKQSRYKGPFQDNVEAFRRADLIDLTRGFIKLGVSKKTIQSNVTQFPYLGFQGVILKEFFKNLLRHPLNPLPMMKR